MPPVSSSNQPADRPVLLRLIETCEAGSEADQAEAALRLEAAGVIPIEALGVAHNSQLHTVHEYVPTFVTALDGRVAALKLRGWQHRNGPVLRRAAVSVFSLRQAP